MTKISYVVLAAYDLQNKESLVYIFNSKTVMPIALPQPIKRLISIEHHIFTAFENGGIYEIESERTVHKDDIEIEER